MSRRTSNVGDWASLISSLHGAYADSHIRQMDAALNKLKVEAQKEENQLQRSHDFALMEFKDTMKEKDRVRQIVDAPENMRFKQYTTNEDGVQMIDNEATMARINEHAMFFSKGSNIGSPTFTKANEYFGMEDVTPGYTTEEDLLVLDEMLQDEYMHSRYERDDMHDEYLRSMGVLNAGETYIGDVMTAETEMGGMSIITKEDLSRRYEAFKEGVRKNPNVYKTEAGYEDYVRANIEGDLKLQSALFQTEASKALKLNISNLPNELKGLLGEDVYELEEIKKGKNAGSLRYSLKDSEYVTNSPLARILTSSDPARGLDSIHEMKMNSPEEYGRWLKKLELEGPQIYNTVMSALKSRHKLIGLEASERKAVDDMISGKKLRLRKNLMSSLQQGKYANTIKQNAQQYESEIKLLFEFAKSEGWSKKELNDRIDEINELYNK